MKPVFVYLFASSICILNCLGLFDLYAQDVIVKKDGSTIISIVEEVESHKVKYKKYSNPDGPSYIIETNEILSINYKNGEIDRFDDKNNTEETKQGNQTNQIINLPPDDNNDYIISLYDKDYYPTEKVKDSRLSAPYRAIVFALSKESVVSNNEVEVLFQRYKHITGEMLKQQFGYATTRISITNKTDGFIYIDRGNCFKKFSHGGVECYYNTNSRSTSSSNSSGVGLGLGAITGVLGIGGAAGTIASGISVGGATTNSVGGSYNQERILVIPPHSSRFLVEDLWLTKEGYVINKPTQDAVPVESADYVPTFPILKKFHQKDELKTRDRIVFHEEDSPNKVFFYITYSTEPTFKTYTVLTPVLYLRNVIGLYDVWQVAKKYPADDTPSTFKLDEFLKDVGDFIIAGVIHAIK